MLLISCNTLFSQVVSQKSEHELWTDFRIGASLGDNTLNVLTTTIDVCYQVDGLLFVSVRGCYSTDRFSDSTMFRNDFNGSTIQDVGCMAGVFTHRKDFKLSVAAGISYLHAWYGNTIYSTTNTINCPIEASVYYIPNHVGIGITIYDNLNSKLNYFGANVGLQVRF